ncbi:unnamed protein product [Rotaria sordida]|uniref:EF-hand domain-containing protein n=2 Tax=Rotaria sordida TaxID=392033 RepID=A0A813ZKA9_9BILA|nr:unnamed protein product [Rotaria sordida]CAF0882460.1 unnamed protein product [Rotaria sordida]CAF0898783.1 unnamed protein product [Rotaria sordida]CAF0900646.1 unnamed protein product [Rotaria sordida]CAF3624109.1 unnamed protein product [Rotaria sordida]
MGNKPVAKLRSTDLEYFRQSTTFTDAEIQDWYKCFHKDCPNGSLTLDEFKKIYAQFFPAGDSSTFAEYVFRRFATNHHDKISFGDFLIALSITARGTLDEKLDWTFGLYDTDGDGFISRNEMFNIVDSIYKMVGSVMQLPEDESTPQKRTDKIFNTFDMDHDGKLSRDEFIQGAKSDPSIMNLLNIDRTPISTANPIRSSNNTLSSMTRLHT